MSLKMLSLDSTIDKELLNKQHNIPDQDNDKNINQLSQQVQKVDQDVKSMDIDINNNITTQDPNFMGQIKSEGNTKGDKLKQNKFHKSQISKNNHQISDIEEFIQENRQQAYNFIAKEQKLREKFEQLSQDNLLFVAGSNLKERENYLNSNKEKYDRTIKQLQFNKLYNQNQLKQDQTLQINSADFRSINLNSQKSIQQNQRQLVQVPLNSINLSPSQFTQQQQKQSKFQNISNINSNQLRYPSAQKCSNYSFLLQEQLIEKNKKCFINKKRHIKQYVEMINTIRRSREDVQNKLKLNLDSQLSQSHKNKDNLSASSLQLPSRHMKSHSYQNIYKDGNLTSSFSDLNTHNSYINQTRNLQTQQQLHSQDHNLEQQTETLTFASSHDPKSLHARYKQHRQASKQPQNTLIQSQQQPKPILASKFQKIKPIFNSISQLKMAKSNQRNNIKSLDQFKLKEILEDSLPVQVNLSKAQISINFFESQSSDNLPKKNSSQTQNELNASQSYRKVLANPVKSNHWDSYIFKSFQITSKKECMTIQHPRKKETFKLRKIENQNQISSSQHQHLQHLSYNQTRQNISLNQNNMSPLTQISTKFLQSKQLQPYLRNNKLTIPHQKQLNQFQTISSEQQSQQSNQNSSQKGLKQVKNYDVLDTSQSQIDDKEGLKFDSLMSSVRFKQQGQNLIKPFTGIQSSQLITVNPNSQRILQHPKYQNHQKSYSTLQPNSIANTVSMNSNRNETQNEIIIDIQSEQDSQAKLTNLKSQVKVEEAKDLKPEVDDNVSNKSSSFVESSDSSEKDQEEEKDNVQIVKKESFSLKSEPEAYFLKVLQKQNIQKERKKSLFAGRKSILETQNLNFGLRQESKENLELIDNEEKPRESQIKLQSLRNSIIKVDFQIEEANNIDEEDIKTNLLPNHTEIETQQPNLQEQTVVISESLKSLGEVQEALQKQATLAQIKKKFIKNYKLNNKPPTTAVQINSNLHNRSSSQDIAQGYQSLSHQKKNQRKLQIKQQSKQTTSVVNIQLNIPLQNSQIKSSLGSSKQTVKEDDQNFKYLRLKEPHFGANRISHSR